MNIEHDEKCPSVAGPGNKASCLCMPGRPYAVRPAPTQFRPVDPAASRSLAHARGLAAALASRRTAAKVLAEHGLDWEAVRAWGREQKLPADHTKPGRMSLLCVDAYLAAVAAGEQVAS